MEIRIQGWKMQKERSNRFKTGNNRIRDQHLCCGQGRWEDIGNDGEHQQEINIRNVDEGTELLDYLEILPKDEAVLLYINGNIRTLWSRGGGRGGESLIIFI